MVLEMQQQQPPSPKDMLHARPANHQHLFRLLYYNQTSWTLLRSRHWHLLDYAVIRRRDKQDIKVTQNYVWCKLLDKPYMLIVSKVGLQNMPKRRPQGKKAFKKLDVSELKKADIVANLSNDLDRKLESLQL